MLYNGFMSTKRRIAKVLIDSPVMALDTLFDYEIPEQWAAMAALRSRVIVPIQKRMTVGFIWDFADHSEYDNLRPIEKVVDVFPLLTETQYRLVDWMAAHYFCNRAEVVRLCLPPGSRLEKEDGFRINCSLDELLPALADALPRSIVERVEPILRAKENFSWTQTEWQKEFRQFPELFEYLLHRQWIEPVQLFGKSRVSPKQALICRWIGSEQERETEAGERVKRTLLNHQTGLTRAQIAAAASVSTAVINRLIREGKVALCQTVVDRVPVGLESPTERRSVSLNEEQSEVYSRVYHSEAGSICLLRGVTGSGKTEIYFELAQKIIADGQQVLYLVPEIALTPQTLKRARERFGETVALLHSNMSDGERYDQWFKIKRGEARFILGARSALFAPFESLGLIVVDEEHESTYKQEESPRYHTREVVEQLARLTGAKVIMGSATPALESFYAAKEGKYTYAEVTRRYNQIPLPEVVVVDMREELKRGNKTIFSGALSEAIQVRLERNEQVVLLLNRRGHSTFVMCRDCGESLRCPSCEVSLTYHSHNTVLRCHYCDYRQPIPNTCPKCHSHRIRYFGNGTQKLEAELAAMFPKAKVIRMDVDSTAGKGAHQRIYQQLTTGEVDILLGTQMIAKGLDLPRVTLVGVIAADSTLNMPDFRGAERTFQLLTQVAGRAGRGDRLGQVIFQTYNPEHYALQYAKTHDYPGFYETEIENRRLLKYPPYTELLKFGFSGIRREQVVAAAEAFRERLDQCISQVASSSKDDDIIEVLGPAPALIEKIQNRYRHQIILKTNRADWLEQIGTEVWNLFPFKKYPETRIIRDRNPYSVL